MSHAIGSCGLKPGPLGLGFCRICWIALNPGINTTIGNTYRIVPKGKGEPYKEPIIQPSNRRGICLFLVPGTDSAYAPDGKLTGCSKSFTHECEIFDKCTRGTQYTGTKCCLTCEHFIPESTKLTIEAIQQNKTPVHGILTREYTSKIEVQRAHYAMALRERMELGSPPEIPFRQGIVMCGGGRYEPSLYVAIKMIRDTGCELPIQIWRHKATEPLSHLVTTLGNVTIHNTDDLNVRRKTGWPMKTLAWLNSGFSHLLYFDADAYPVVDPTSWFKANMMGCVIFKDFDKNDDFLKRHTYPFMDMDRVPPTLNGGHYVIDVKKTWRAIKLACHFDQYDDYWHQFRNGVGGYSEQDQFRAALGMTGAGWSIWPKPFLYSRDEIGGAFLHYGPNKEEAIVHRVGSKFALLGSWPKPPHRLNWLPKEERAWEFFEEYLRKTGNDKLIEQFKK